MVARIAGRKWSLLQQIVSFVYTNPVVANVSSDEWARPVSADCIVMFVLNFIPGVEVHVGPIAACQQTSLTWCLLSEVSFRVKLALRTHLLRKIMQRP